MQHSRIPHIAIRHNGNIIYGTQWNSYVMWHIAIPLSYEETLDHYTSSLKTLLL